MPHAIPFFPIEIVPDPLAAVLPGAYCLEAGSFEVGRKRQGEKREEKAFFFPPQNIPPLGKRLLGAEEQGRRSGGIGIQIEPKYL